RPVIIITSNAKKDLSDPFLGRCNFHHIAFPEPDMMREIVQVHFPGISRNLLDAAVNTFYRLREFKDVEKKPATRELINWIRALKADPDFEVKDLINGKMGRWFQSTLCFEKLFWNQRPVLRVAVDSCVLLREVIYL
ncbi:MAG TPA: hypothetical protein VMW42_05970, partial [Desulfatiglandales bacterium]|nr:hypothetical protein [Desulfatiglandales bacterium]